MTVRPATPDLREGPGTSSVAARRSARMSAHGTHALLMLLAAVLPACGEDDERRAVLEDLKTL